MAYQTRGTIGIEVTATPPRVATVTINAAQSRLVKIDKDNFTLFVDVTGPSGPKASLRKVDERFKVPECLIEALITAASARLCIELEIDDVSAAPGGATVGKITLPISG